MQWQSSRKMSRPETSRIGFLGVLCSTEFSVHFLEINRKCRRHKEKKRKMSAVFEVDKWSFSVDMKLRFCGWFLALGHHPKPQHHWAGTVPMTKFGISIFAKKNKKKHPKNYGAPWILEIHIPFHTDSVIPWAKIGFFWGWWFWQVLWPATKEDIEILSQWQAWQAETYLVVFCHHNWAVISGPWVSFYNVLSRKLHWSHFSWCLSAMNSGFHINDSRCILKLMSVGLTNCIHDLSKLKVPWSSGGGGISRNAGKKPKTFFVVSTCFSKTSSFDDIWLEVHLGNDVKKMIGWKPLMKCSRLVRLSDPVAALGSLDRLAVSRPQTWSSC